MATIRITGNKPNNIKKMEWLGVAPLDRKGHLRRGLDIPEVAYLGIERGIANGALEGFVNLDNGLRYEWYRDG